MNQFDRTVGGGITSLLQAGHEDMSQPGAFNFAPKSEPVLRMAVGGFADFGKYQEEDTSYLPDVTASAIPTLPSDIGSYNPQQKGALYNQLIGQGFTDAQVRAAAGVQSDTDWAALQGIASTLNKPAATTTAPVAASTTFAPTTSAPAISSPATSAPATVATTTAAPAFEFGSPSWFKDYIYKGGVDDVTATKRGVEWILSQKLAPQAAVDLWNKALGTSFTLADYYRITGITPPAAAPAPAPPPATTTTTTLQNDLEARAERLLEALDQGFITQDEFWASMEILEAQASEAPAAKTVAPTAATGALTQAETTAPAAAAATTGALGAATGATAQTAVPTGGGAITKVEKPAEGSPEWFRDYIYQGGANDATATQRGLDWAKQKGLNPAQTVSLWNQSLGTNFAVNDFFKVAGEPAPSKTTVFGDSISSVVGYNPDGSANTSQGKSLEDILSNYTGGVVNNVATGGQTSSDALSGNTGYGSFEKYLKESRPDQVILRYGAADAIKLGDASKSLGNIEQMINLAKKNGSTPVLVGVSPFYGGADSIGGNIAGYLTPESAKVADQINEGIKQLAQKYGLQFVNVRDIEIPSGSLLDGVHQDVRLGKAMADKIGESIAPGEQKRTIGSIPKDISRAGETGANVISNLQTAGLQESTDLNNILYGGPQQNLTVQNAVATADRIAKEKAAPVTAANLIQQLNLNAPEFAKGFDFTNVGRMGDESTGVIQAPSTQFGGYEIKALGQFADVGEGSYAPTGTLGGYEATKTETQANGKPLISTLKYDPSGSLTGSTVRAYEGSDSGTEYTLDAAGNVVGSRKFDESEAWKTTAAALLPMATMAFAPGLSNYFAGLAGAGAAGATAADIALAKAIGAGATGALFGGTGAALAGKEGSDLLKAAALGGASGAVGAGIAGQAGKAAGEFAGNLFAGNEDLASLASSVAKGAVESGIKALPGAIATGDTGRLLTGALTGGTLGAVNSLTSDIELPFTQKQAEAGINLVRAVNSGNLTSAANAAATLINNPDITVATRAATLLKAVQSGNPTAILAASQMLANAATRADIAATTKTAEAPGGAFETSAIIDEFGDTGGTLVPGEAGDVGQRVEVTGGAGATDLSDLLSTLSLTTPTGTKTLDTTGTTPKVEIAGTRLPEEKTSVEDLIDLLTQVKATELPAATVTQPETVRTEERVPERVEVTGTGESAAPADLIDEVAPTRSLTPPTETTTLGTTGITPSVEVTGTRLPEEQTSIDDLIDLLTQTKTAELPVATIAPTQTVETTGTRITPEELDPFVDLFDKDLVGDRVVIPGTKIAPEELDPFVALLDKDLVDQRVQVEEKKLPPDQTVEVTGTRLPPDETVEVTGTKLPPDQTVEVTDTKIPPDQTVEVTDTKLPPEDDSTTTTTTDGTKKDDVTDQKVTVTDTKLPPETTTTTTPPVTTPPKTTPPKITPTKPRTTTTTTYETPSYTPMQEAAPAQAFRPGVVTDAYEVLFGPGAPTLMGFTKAERAKQILAQRREEEENRPETAYERLMSMADRNLTIDDLMKIIEGGQGG